MNSKLDFEPKRFNVCFILSFMTLKSGTHEVSSADGENIYGKVTVDPI